MFNVYEVHFIDNSGKLFVCSCEQKGVETFDEDLFYRTLGGLVNITKVIRTGNKFANGIKTWIN